MNSKQQEIVEKWIAALRSGKYKQTRGQLKRFSPFKNRPSYCCLGVLCEIHPDVKSDIDNIYIIENHRRATSIGASFLNLTGFGPFDETRLIEMNDEEKATFPEIADYLQELLDEQGPSDDS